MPFTASPVATDLPLWRGIATVLEDAIISGDLPLGSRIPGEPELVHLFGASRPTIVKAVRHLAAHGFVERRQGIGTFVTTAQRIPTTTLLRLHAHQPFAMRPAAAVGGSVNVVALSGGKQVGTFRIDAEPAPWKSPEELLDIEVLAGNRGWTGCRSHIVVDLDQPAAAEPQLRVRVAITDAFSDRTCTITTLLDPSAFSVEIEQPF